MSKIILNIAKKDKNIKLVYLRVFKINKNTIEFYKKLGFRKVAVLPRRLQYKGKYVDGLIMDLPLKR